MYPSNIFKECIPYLDEMMYKVFRTDEWKAVINSKTKDFEIYKALKAWNNTLAQSSSPEEINKYRIWARVKEFKNIFNYIRFKPKNQLYLDFGSATGVLTNGIAEVYKFKAYATDIAEWHGEKRLQLYKSVEFKQLTDGKIPFVQKFDIITCLMVLHHIDETLDNVIKDFKAHLNPNGIIILREHDVTDARTEKLCHIEHALHDVTSGRTFAEFKREYYAKYQSGDYWVDLFRRHGFKCLMRTPPKGPTAYFYSVYSIK